MNKKLSAFLALALLSACSGNNPVTAVTSAVGDTVGGVASAVGNTVGNVAHAVTGTVTGQTTQTCQSISEAEVASLFDRWNASLATGNPDQVVANYAPQSILLPTVSNQPRLTAEEKADYFHHFLANKPSGQIDQRFIQIGCNTALDAGLYTFTYGKNGKKVSGRYSYTYAFDGQNWLITHHHSSVLPEQVAKKGKK